MTRTVQMMSTAAITSTVKMLTSVLIGSIHAVQTHHVKILLAGSPVAAMKDFMETASSAKISTNVKYETLQKSRF